MTRRSAQERAVEPTPQDITAQEVRIECFFPLDADTAAAARQLGADAREAQ